MIREYKNFVEPEARFQTLFLIFEETEFWKLMVDAVCKAGRVSGSNWPGWTWALLSGHEDRPAGSEQLHVLYDAVMPGAITNLSYSSDQQDFDAVYSNLIFFVLCFMIDKWPAESGIETCDIFR